MTGERMVSRPSQRHGVPGASCRMAPKVLACVDRPIMDSEKKMGSDSRKEDRMYTKINAAPPFSPTM